MYTFSKLLLFYCCRLQKQYIEKHVCEQWISHMSPMKNKMESSKSDGLKIPKDNSSAFHLYDKKRDSGYLTNSPATPATPNNNLQFNFDEDIVSEENSISHSAKFNKFEDSGELSDDCFYDAEEMSENTDKEVECAMSLENIRSVPIPILVRPSAPAPQLDNDVPGNLECISETLHFTAYSFNRGSSLRSSSHHYKRRHFRPIGQRTISTQTPHQNSQILQQAVNTLSDRFHPYDAPLARGELFLLLLHHPFF